MRLLAILAASLALALAGCNRDNSAGAGGTSPSYKSPSSGASSTPGGAASGSSSSPSGSPGSSSSSKGASSSGK